ncbi:NUDIX hydrolase [Streptomyces sp. NPDC006516]|uniref:NUDIX hydrolase n=1 Tax=Streptomyces sp. NPDC006516 TaxID=3154309 RepID=UPI0033A1747F
MDTPRAPLSPPPAGTLPRATRRAALRGRDAVTLLPRGAAALALTVIGRAGSACSLLRAVPPPGAPRPSPVRVAGHAVTAVLLGAPALVLAGVTLLALARGPFYGFVDQGPYDNSWGGPGKGGAWLAHFAVAVPCCLAATAGLHGLAGLHDRLTAPLRGRRRAGWVLPTALVCCLAGALFVWAFARQLP